MKAQRLPIGDAIGRRAAFELVDPNLPAEQRVVVQQDQQITPADVQRLATLGYRTIEVLP